MSTIDAVEMKAIVHKYLKHELGVSGEELGTEKSEYYKRGEKLADAVMDRVRKKIELNAQKGINLLQIVENVRPNEDG